VAAEKKDFKDTYMRDEYDLSKGGRGKHYKAYRECHIIRIREDDGTMSVQYFIQ
jgi:hypothetical protein